MALPEPSWRVKTRPCPFFQQGKCMFADSCNFLHNASATVIPEAKSSKENTTQVAAGPSTPHIPPRVIVDSPQSIRSSPRSPRTSSLLLALRDIIGDPDDEDATSGANHTSTSQNEADVWSESLPTLVNENGFGHFSRPDERTLVEQVTEDEEDEDYEGNWTAISDYDDESSGAFQENDRQHDTLPYNDGRPEDIEPAYEEDTFQIRFPVQRGSYEPLSSEHTVRYSTATEQESSIASSASGLLSPIELSTINLGPLFQINNSPRDTNSFDSGYADNWKPPNPLLASPPRSPSISSTFDLLSSPFGSHSARVLSPHLGAFMARSPVSSARTASPSIPDEIEPLDLGLDSPSDYHNNQQTANGAGSIVDESADSIDQDTLLSELAAEPPEASKDEDEDVVPDSYGHTSIWDVEGGSTAVYIGQPERPLSAQVEDAIKRSSRTPTHFLASSELQFQDSEVLGDSFNVFAEDTSQEDDGNTSTSHALSSQAEEDHNSDDDTAFLAYLNSPQAPQNENDTLNSLYDVYSGIEADSTSNSINTEVLSPGRQQPSPLSNPSTPASSLRERVFTPPAVTRKRSGTITADSPNSLASPMTSLDSVSRGRASPFSVANTKSPVRGSGSQSPSGQELDAFRKVPFGFRSTFALGRASRSSLMTSRNSGRSVPSSPLETHMEIPGPESRPSAPEYSPTRPNSQAPKGLKPLRLSTVFDAKHFSRSLIQSRMPSSSVKSVTSFRQSGNTSRASLSSASVSSNNSLSDNRLLSSARSSLLPLDIRRSLIPSGPHSPTPHTFKNIVNLDEPRSAPATSWRQSINYSRSSSRLSEPFYEHEDEDDEDDTDRFSRNDPYGETIRRPIPITPHTAPVSRAPSVLRQPTYAIDTPKPTLMFAIASDNVDEVRQVLESGDANPNEAVGPQSALAFALTNDKLSNKLDIVKMLLAYGADPSVAKNISTAESSRQEPSDQQEPEDNQLVRTLMDELDPATRYYLERADSVHTRRISVLIQRSFFRPLTRVRYDLIGQDRALEQLFRVLSMHSRNLAVTPMVVLLCGPSGHGKSLLARKFGSLLDVPTHTVNMTTLRSTHDLWQSYSMSPYETPTTTTLAEFLINNEGKRCVVVLDEIEKTADDKALWSLLMPWELGRCSFEASSRHVDVRNVIWLGTSNIGHDLVFQHWESRKNPEELMSREEYVELMALLRPKVSERLGASVLSRITTVVPFVPFSLEEKKAICSEALYTLGGELARSLSPERIEAMMDIALGNYSAPEGARSLSRAISNQLVDMI